MSRPSLYNELELLFETRSLPVSQIFEHPDFEEFSRKFHLTIPHKELAQAFTHKSFSHEFNVPHQEQLEFLGDAVLQLILTDELYRLRPSEKEGNLSKLRSAIVNENSLATLGRGIGLQKLILVGKGEFKKGLPEQSVVLADTFEALLGQIYRHHGLEFTKHLFLTWLNQYIPKAFDENFLDDFDAKSKLQEKVLAKYKKLPRYNSENEGEQFKISLWINEELVAQGVFSSKKSGEKELAQEVLKKGLL